MKNYKDGDRIRIWLEDSMEPGGGLWCYATIKEVVTITSNVFCLNNKFWI